MGLSVSRLTLFFAVLGAVAGAISGIMTSANIRLNTAAPLIAIVLFYISYKLAAHEKIKNKFLVAPVEEPEGKKVNVIFTGIWPHFIMWLIFWVLVYTLLIVK